MKNQNILLPFISFLLLSFNSLIAQDESRIGLSIGYEHSWSPFQDFDYDTYSGINIAIDRKVRISRTVALKFGLDYSKLNLELQATNGSAITPAAPLAAHNLNVIGFYGGALMRILPKTLFAGFGFRLDHDLSYPTDFRYEPMNGLGIYFNFGTDIHITDEFVLTISPQFSVRGLYLFRSNSLKRFDLLSSSQLKSTIINITAAYKFF